MIDSILMRLFNLFHEGRRDRRGKRQALVEELADLHSVYEAALSEFFLARENDADDARSSNSMMQWIALGRFDGRLQKMHVQVRSAFKGSSPVIAAVSELQRRYMMTKQFLMFSEKGDRADGFAAALNWLNYQARYTIGLAAESLGIDLADSSHPFLIGFEPIGPPNATDPFMSGAQPWEMAQATHAAKEAKRLWEEAGHTLTAEQEDALRHTFRKL